MFAEGINENFAYSCSVLCLFSLEAALPSPSVPLKLPNLQLWYLRCLLENNARLVTFTIKPLCRTCLIILNFYVQFILPCFFIVCDRSCTPLVAPPLVPGTSVAIHAGVKK